MATPPILFSYKNDYKSLPIITPEASETIQEVTEVEKSENVPEDPTANVLEESCLDDSRPLKLAWPTSKHTPFGTKLNFSLENDTPVPEQEDAIFDAHLNAFQLPGTSTAASKKDDALKKPLRSNSHNSSIRCVCGTKYTCLVHLKVPSINASQSNLSADDLPITSHDETLIETPPLDSNSISMHFSHEMKTMLCAIFGEPETETDLAESSEVEVPIWICQQLYNAWKKQPVMENPMDIITKQDEALGLQDEEIARLLCKELNGFEVGYGQPPLAFAQNNMASHLTLQLLHEKYDKYFNPNIVEDIYRECKYANFEL
uniref:DNA replication complex GINS protein PSF3 n=1 Tax=Acrobeloides nanus TaxID=290746 RepID=A0A914DX54_9BILA